MRRGWTACIENLNETSYGKSSLFHLNAFSKENLGFDYSSSHAGRNLPSIVPICHFLTHPIAEPPWRTIFLPRIRSSLSRKPLKAWLKEILY
ncbi:hypothetical protein M413DRAFT_259555 [Hebeloma cylindrosporum]|uniref:Uncharacterized protein n=1 Tax=Hebeloma cylindrosporum TaxID=76867 RepID=A0A0C3CRC0_HEBCY|nr:hypothetical protein M413DRAFT_259555 [Hebeloma cylindrosporum h7]